MEVHCNPRTTTKYYDVQNFFHNLSLSNVLVYIIRLLVKQDVKIGQIHKKR